MPLTNEEWVKERYPKAKLHEVVCPELNPPSAVAYYVNLHNRWFFATVGTKFATRNFAWCKMAVNLGREEKDAYKDYYTQD